MGKQKALCKLCTIYVLEGDKVEGKRTQTLL